MIRDCRMSWTEMKWLAGAVIMLLSWSGCYGMSASCQDLSHGVMRALTGTLSFFAGEYDQVNLDALVGIRMAQSQLQAALDDLDLANNPEMKPFRDELQSLSDQAEAICNQAIPVVKRHYPKDYRDLGALASSHFWSTGNTAQKRQTNRAFSSLPRQTSGSEAINEPLSDMCIAQLLGVKSKPCSISSFCWLAMTPRGYRSYSLSHQVLYLTVGSMMGCGSHMKRWHRPVLGERDESLLDSLMDGFCSDVFLEAQQIAQDGFPVGSQDLFMEQVLFCGLKGYEDFFQLSWLQAVLSWQDESGCFADDVYRPRASTDENADHPAISYEHIRQRRSEKEIAGTGCLMHKTSVGTGFLSIYLRLLLETMATEPTKTPCL